MGRFGGRQIVDRLKRRYGTRADLYRYTGGYTDQIRSSTLRDYDAQSGVEVVAVPKSLYAQLFGIADTNSQPIDTESIIFIISGEQTLGTQDQLVWNEKRYSIKKVIQLDADTGYMIEAIRLELTVGPRIHSVDVYTSLSGEVTTDAD